ncbi:hypothetical protein Nepgr_032669 [Nepenthes gracilis]|uniref:Uncharacterized protein n=1 Tax=Nepenthes gracilis TaxID=150966 RepID=A0AAD3Y8H0_NEPGR|nr:hypothetical protein Nepgr_032669 [Nepenthes gracilis]
MLQSLTLLNQSIVIGDLCHQMQLIMQLMIQLPDQEQLGQDGLVAAEFIASMKDDVVLLPTDPVGMHTQLEAHVPSASSTIGVLTRKDK